MKITTKSPQKFVLGIIAATSLFSVLVPQNAQAQSTDVNPLQDFQPQQGDPFSSRNDDPTGSLFDLIHRAQLGNSRSAEEFNADKNQNLNDAAAEFRKKQQQRIQTPTPENTVNTPATTPLPNNLAN